MIEKTWVIRQSHIDLLSMARIPFVLFGFVEGPASHLDRRCAGMRKCRERQDAGSDTPSSHSNGYASSGDHPTCLAGSPTKSHETAGSGFEQPTGWPEGRKAGCLKSSFVQ